MKRLLLLTAAALFGLHAFSQSPIGEGGKQINFGLGLYSDGIPLYVGADFGIHPDITIGGQLGLDLGFDYFALSARGDYHFNTLLEIPRDWDFYAGLSAGFVSGIDNEFDSGVDLGIQVGGRYYWSSDWAINLEFGGGNNLAGGRFGLSKRF
jgi:hypothetical protein